MTRIYLVQQESVIEMLRLHKKNPRKKKSKKKKRGRGKEEREKMVCH
jgi:hypothetical protein